MKRLAMTTGRLSSSLGKSAIWGAYLLGLGFSWEGSVSRAEELPSPVRVAIDKCKISMTLAAKPRGGRAGHTVQLSEIYYQSAANDPKLEFLELVNTGTEPVYAAGWEFSKGIESVFAEGTTLAAGSYGVICKDSSALLKVFGPDVPVIGKFQGRLRNGGERLRLIDRMGKTVTGVRYDDRAPWPTIQEGQNLSIQMRDLGRDVNDPGNWAAADPTPGRSGVALERPGSWFSVYQYQHAPAAPKPHQKVAVSAWLENKGKTDFTLSFHVDANGSRFQTSRRIRALPGDQRHQIEAMIPPLPGNCLVRYRFSVEPDEGAPVSFPAAHSQEPVPAYFLAGTPDTSSIPIYQLTIEQSNWDAIHRRPLSNETYRATMVAEDRAYPVSVRCRGAFARKWPKKSYKFFFENSGGFQNQSRINLNSAWHDVAYVRESLAYSIYEDLGVPASQTQFVRLDVNGSFWGLYVQVEQPDKAFLKKHNLEDAVLYKANSGDLSVSDQRELGSLEDYKRFYEKETRKEEPYTDLAEFCRGLAQSDDAETFFKENVDLDQYVNYLTATALIQNWDCYNKNGN